MFGHDDNVRRLSSPHSVSRSNVVGDDTADVEDGNGARCTTAKVKSFMKSFFAHLFSQVGLCALVIGYSIMGAFVFGKLEKDNELNTRQKVGDTRKDTLEQLYNITGRCYMTLGVICNADDYHNLGRIFLFCHIRLKKKKNFGATMTVK